MSHLDPTDAERHPAADVVVIGGGIIGCASAAILADRGARVTLIEARSIGAAASGRNLGAIQHPLDPILAPLYRESIGRYRALADATDGMFAIGYAPSGILLLNPDADAARRQAEALGELAPELQPRSLDPDEVAAAEPALASGLAAVEIETGYPVTPSGATAAWAELADERGARLLIGTEARVDVRDGRAAGVVLEDGTTIAAGAVLVAGGPWSSELVDPAGGWHPMAPTYGVTVQLRLPAGTVPGRIVEEDELDAVNRSAAATERAAKAGGGEPPSLFSLATAGGISTLGSTFLPDVPDEVAISQLLLRRAARFLPAIADAEVLGLRTCARPQSVDGRPFIGPVADIDGLFVCTGHGPWGISIGPATAAIAARAILDRTPPPAELDARRST